MTQAQAQAQAEFDRIMDIAEAHYDRDELAEYDRLRAQAYDVLAAVGMTRPQ
jgi:hypothetical protein